MSTQVGYRNVPYEKGRRWLLVRCRKQVVLLNPVCPSRAPHQHKHIVSEGDKLNKGAHASLCLPATSSARCSLCLSPRHACGCCEAFSVYTIDVLGHLDKARG
jgi:hypothetical protein